ncbi:cyclic nucleotide-binding domain-containing protein [Paenibacillus oenotherae]|uniref:Cyclic nucleotide-binding domain-containing protein n=1 Tax=Paenibacillus oenotherae TaxID=1435645 RepID=A0ABS7D677_9BACL|nr:cyclic nucleotide-binding domain-containing protein [Paenibacillus oenotherae]MBW7475445.1 cyclic nucleotide-binding domain-containing protein [Paenibacillus oenotherae]
MSIETARLRQLSLFENIGEDALEAMAGIFVVEQLDGDQYVLRQGEEGSKFYMIESGKVEISRLQEDGQRVVLAVLKEGDHFGEIALMRKSARNADVRTVTPCLLVTITHENFHELLERQPHIKSKLEKLLAERS